MTDSDPTAARGAGSPSTLPPHDVADLGLADEGVRRIEWAEREMPVLRLIGDRFAGERPLAGMRIGACLHVTTETANLMRTLQAGGAEVALAALAAGPCPAPQGPSARATTTPATTASTIAAAATAIHVRRRRVRRRRASRWRLFSSSARCSGLWPGCGPRSVMCVLQRSQLNPSAPRRVPRAR